MDAVILLIAVAFLPSAPYAVGRWVWGRSVGGADQFWANLMATIMAFFLWLGVLYQFVEAIT